MKNLYIENIVKKSGSSFYFAMKLLPKNKRFAMYTVYAFCRIIDDIADGDDVYELKIKNLTFWRNELENIFKENPQTELGKNLVIYVKEFNLEKKDFIAVIDGMEMDLPNGIVAPSNEVLSLYCRMVAGAVGLISIKIFGEDNENTRDFAVNLGEALQLTNIIRDVKEDSKMGRLYISKEILKEAGIDIFDPVKTISHTKIGKALEILSVKAKEKYRLANANLKKADFCKMYPAFIMMKIYEKILIKLEKRGFNVLEPKIKPNIINLLAIVAETIVRSVICPNKKLSI